MYPSTIYRVVVKALIINDQGQVYAVKEGEDFWSLPGGGLEHGETTQQCLERELREEIGATDVHIGEVAHIATVHLDQKDFWMTWIVHKVTANTNNLTPGEDVTEARFIDISEIDPSDHVIEKLLIETVLAATS